MKLRTRSSVQNYKRRDNTIPDPDTDPGLPPRQLALYHQRNDHPRVDVETIRNPKCDKIDAPPCPLFWRDWRQVLIGQKQLAIR